jgi:hypothetical protein
MLRSNKLILMLFLTMSVIFLQSSVMAQEVNEDYQNYAIEPQTGVFLATFTATPTVSLVDGVLGLSKDEPDSYGDFSCKIIFNNAGFVAASNGPDFEAETALAYTGGTAHAFKVLVNILDQTYSVWVTPAGGEEVTIGENFAFSPGAGVVDSINWRSVKMSFGLPWGGAEGTVLVTDFTIELPDEMNVSAAFEPQTERVKVEFNAHPTASLVDGVIGFSKDKPNKWDSPLKMIFNNSGKFTASNAGSYEALNDFDYSGGMTYEVRMVIDIPMQTFDVWIAPEGGAEVAIGKDYGFSSAADTLQWRTVIMSFAQPWGGAVGFVEITDFTISEVRTTCAFFSKKGWDSRDSLLVEKLEEKYDVTIFNARSFVGDTLKIDTLYNFDFTFISESTSSWPWEYNTGVGMRSIPIPMLSLEGYLTKSQILGWTTLGSDTGYGTIAEDTMNVGVAHNVLIIDDTGHELSAGFGVATEVTLVTETSDDDLGVLTFSVPEITHIPIAVSSLDPTKTVVMGVEKGTTVWNYDGTVLGESDSTVTKSRAAMVGIFASANDYITDDGWKLINAGIDWILKDGANAIGDIVSVAPSEFNLQQNYPNPFNPSTEIAFTLSQPGRTTLTVFNVLGQKVATLLDQKMVKGTHQVTFDAHGLASGVYFYQIRSNDFSQIKKMVLMK